MAPLPPVERCPTRDLAGRAAEQLIFKELDIGAKNDLDFATNMARMMVEDLGMSEQFGPRVYRLSDGTPVTVGGVTRERIDKEINQILHKQYEAVESMMEDNLDQLERLTAGLLEHGELESPAIAKLLGMPHPENQKSNEDSTSSEPEEGEAHG